MNNISSKQNYEIYIGGYTHDVFIAKYSNGTLDNIKPFAQLQNPSYLAFSKNNNVLYALSEKSDSSDIYSVNDKGETFSHLKVPGKGLCHISVNEKFLFGACYQSGHVFSISIGKDGELKELVSVFDHNEYKNIKNAAARAHYITATKDNKHVLAVDLGLDSLIVYSLEDNGKMEYRAHFKFDDNVGPRHLCFNKNDPSVIYLLSEYSNELYTFKFDDKSDKTEEISRIPSYMEPLKAKSSGAAVKISPDGKKVAVSNRVENSDGIIAIFDISADNLPVKYKSVNTGGVIPRDFEFTPDSKYIISANQNSNNVTVICLENNDIKSYPVFAPTCIIIKNK